MGPPAELIKGIAAEFGIDTFVETGTHHGGTAVWAADHFRYVYTIEYSKQLYDQTNGKYGSLPNIEFIFGDSRTELNRLRSTLEGPAIFWLDAHWSGDWTYGDEDQCPLLEEIQIINSSGFDHLIFIDDARLFTSPPQAPHRVEQWPDITATVQALRSIDSDKYIVIIEDVIIAVPSLARTFLAEYCREQNARLWANFSRQQSEPNYVKGLKLIYEDLPSIVRAPLRAPCLFYSFIKSRTGFKRHETVGE
jgi:hypothetical protein